MRRLSALAVCIPLLLALNASATAEEELPEVGRCVRMAGSATHKYATGNCTTRSEGEDTGHFEWEPGPGPRPGFTSRSAYSELETTGRMRIGCISAAAKGEFTGPKTDVATITLSGCEYSQPNGILCETAGAREGEIVMGSLEGQLGYISGAGTSRPSVGMRLQPVSGTQLAAVECSGIDVTLTGSVIGTISDIDKMTFTTGLKFRSARGTQIPESFEGGAPSQLTATVGEPEQAGLDSVETNTNEEALEVKAIN